jgi:lysophosphatidic acid phosphatase type 6
MRHLLLGGCHAGCLTVVGREDALFLGKALRSRYIDQMGFISPVYSPEDVYIRSTNIRRTIESARLVGTGMFGGTGVALRVETEVDAKETLYPNSVLCPRLRELFLEAAK